MRLTPVVRRVGHQGARPVGLFPAEQQPDGRHRTCPADRAAQVNRLSLLTPLEEIGYVGRDGRRYRSGWLLFELGTGVNSIAPVRMRNISLPHMADLFAQTRQTVHLGALHGREIIHVARMRGAQSAVSPIRFGGRGPATCSAMGKIILAHRPPDVVQQVLSGPLERMTRYSIIAPGVLFQQLRDARERGYAAEREETAIGLVAIAVPIHRGRSVVGALSIAARSRGSTSRPIFRPCARPPKGSNWR